jgi:ribose transport system substrate-binding protein
MAQAVDGNAAAVITNGYPYEFAPNAFDAVQAAGIPLLYGLASPTGDGDPTKVAYLTPDPIALQVWLSSWVIADSNAAANVLAIKITDTPSSTAFADLGMLATYEKNCSDCKVQVIEINVAQYDRLPSLISAALVANPDITYVHMEFDSGLPSVLQGIQSAGRDDVKVVSGDGYLSTLQDMKAGSPIVADASANYAAFAWYQADAVIRMAVGEPAAVKFAFPLRRLFTVDNVADLDVTADGEASGDWYGTVDYKGGLLDLWGVK